MTLAVAVGAGLGSALAYGAATAGQHAAAYTGSVDGRGLAALLRNPRWLAATVGDVIGVALQVVALDNGPVVLVQPLLILALPVAVIGRWVLGAPRPSRADALNCLAVILALSGFFALLGQPAAGHTISTAASAWTFAGFTAVGLILIALVRHQAPVPRAIVFGAVAGCWFGLVSVLIEAVADVYRDRGLAGFGTAAGLVPLVGVVVLALAAYLLVQIGFQLGPLGASFPPNLILDPVVAVLVGALLLNERVPVGGVKIVGYLICLAVVAWGAIRLAEPAPRPDAEPVSGSARIAES